MKFVKISIPVFLSENIDIFTILKNSGISSFELKDNLDIKNNWFVKSILNGSIKVYNASVKYANLNGRPYFTWLNGTWIDGTWEGDSWKNGTWKSGIWKKGNWYNGIWEFGTWEYGIWRGGIWEDGIWEDGTFREDNPSIKSVWKNGTWEGGNWRAGIHKNGIWNGGTWIGGIWENGEWNGGDWDSDLGWNKGKINGMESISPPKFRSFYDKTKDLAVGIYSHPIEELNNIHNPNIYYIVDFLSKYHKKDELIDLNLIKTYERNNGRFKSNLEKIIGKTSKGFSINNILSYDENPYTDKPTNISQLKLHKNLELNLSTWSGGQNPFYKKNQNYVLQLNYNGNFGDISDHPNDIHKMIKNSIDPIDKKSLTLSWCRFTVFKDQENKHNSYVILDELQSLYENKYPYLMDGFIKNWAEFTVKIFINYVRNSLGIRKIKFPKYETKLKKYESLPSPPVYLYSDIPRKFGFKKDKNDPEFLILENIY